MVKKYFLGAIFAWLAYSHIVLSCDAAQKKPEHLIFIGNPGVGKSTLINSLVGKAVAESGISSGIGMTKFFSEYPHDGDFYMDTPGLADIMLREQAALEIEKALKREGKYRIFFVMVLQAGRVKPEDVTTINTVMDAVKDGGNEFNVIINMLTKKEYNFIVKEAVNMAAVYAQINSGKHTTNSIMYIGNDPEIDDGNTDFITIDAPLKKFIYESSKLISIKSEDIAKIKTDEFEAIKEQFEAGMKVLRDELATGNDRHKDLINQMSKLQDALKEAKDKADKADEKRKKLKTKIKDANDNAQTAGEDAERAREAQRKAEKERDEAGTCSLF